MATAAAAAARAGHLGFGIGSSGDGDGVTLSRSEIAASSSSSSSSAAALKVTVTSIFFAWFKEEAGGRRGGRDDANASACLRLLADGRTRSEEASPAKQTGVPFRPSVGAGHPRAAEPFVRLDSVRVRPRPSVRTSVRTSVHQRSSRRRAVRRVDRFCATQRGAQFHWLRRSSRAELRRLDSDFGARTGMDRERG